MTIEIGDRIPSVELLDSENKPFALDRYLGAPLLLYFYPKDDTAGCTREAQEFSAEKAAFDALGVQLLGVSRDTAAKHRKFAAKYDLTVPLGDPREASIRTAIGFLSGTACTSRIAEASAGASAQRSGARVMTEPEMLTPDHPSVAQRELPGLF